MSVMGSDDLAGYAEVVSGPQMSRLFWSGGGATTAMKEYCTLLCGEKRGKEDWIYLPKSVGIATRGARAASWISDPRYGLEDMRSVTFQKVLIILKVMSVPPTAFKRVLLVMDYTALTLVLEPTLVVVVEMRRSRWIDKGRGDRSCLWSA